MYPVVIWCIEYHNNNSFEDLIFFVRSPIHRNTCNAFDVTGIWFIVEVTQTLTVHRDNIFAELKSKYFLKSKKDI